MKFGKVALESFGFSYVKQVALVLDNVDEFRFTSASWPVLNGGGGCYRCRRLCSLYLHVFKICCI